MSKKTYTLELTAEELERWDRCGMPDWFKRVDDLKLKARADREADELRLPWRARLHADTRCSGWLVEYTQASHGGVYPETWWCSGREAMAAPGEAVAKLASAAPELLEAVTAVKEFWVWARTDNRLSGEAWQWVRDTVNPAVCRALRKVETGEPE